MCIVELCSVNILGKVFRKYDMKHSLEIRSKGKDWAHLTRKEETKSK